MLVCKLRRLSLHRRVKSDFLVSVWSHRKSLIIKQEGVPRRTLAMLLYWFSPSQNGHSILYCRSKRGAPRRTLDMLLYSLYSFLRSLNTLPHQRIALSAGLGSARVLVRLASSSWGSRPYLVVQIVHLRRSKYQQRRCHKERREVLCATNDSTLVYEYHVIHLSTTNRECPSWASVLSKTPKSLVVRTLTRKSIFTR